MLLSLNPPCSYLPKKTDPAYLYLLENGKSRTAFQDQTTVHPAHLIFIYHIPTPQASIVLGFPGSSAGKKKKICLQCRRPQFNSWVRKIPWRKDGLPIPVFLGFPGASDGKESASNVGALGSIRVLGGCPGGGHGNPHQYAGLVNPHGQRRPVGVHGRGRAGPG